MSSGPPLLDWGRPTETFSTIPRVAFAMAVETDDRGRLYLRRELRDKFGERFRIVELENRIQLIPVADEPLEDPNSR